MAIPIGTIKEGKEIGYKSDGYHYWVWYPCRYCFKLRWVLLSKGQITAPYCSSCSKRVRKRKTPPLLPEPTLGEVRSSIYFKTNHSRIWIDCPTCGRTRWVCLHVYAKSRGLCHKCAVELSGLRQRLDRRVSEDGHFYIRIDIQDPLYEMANANGWVFEHRYIMAKSLNRPLEKSEIVHHRNHIKSDNRIENLELTTRGSHILRHNADFQAGYELGLIDNSKQQL